MITLYGGSFDPVHIGHRFVVDAVDKLLQSTHWLIIPSKQQVLKSSHHASTSQRLDMLRLAFADKANVMIDEREIKRSEPSYAVNTLASIRKEHPDTRLVWVLGSDSFITLPQWHRWQELLNHTHLLVVPRPDYALTQLEPTLQTYLDQHKTPDLQQLQQSTHGLIYVYDCQAPAISATAIRESDDKEQFLDPRVANYIEQHQLY